MRHQVRRLPWMRPAIRTRASSVKEKESDSLEKQNASITQEVALWTLGILVLICMLLFSLA